MWRSHHSVAATATKEQKPAESPKATPPATVVGSSCTGLDARQPCLAPNDVSFTDSRDGAAGWGDRCFIHMGAGKLGWAKAACDRGLAMNRNNSMVRGALLYNLGLVARLAGDRDEARRRFIESLTGRPGHPAAQSALRDLNPGSGGEKPDAIAELTLTDARALEIATKLVAAGWPPAVISGKLNKRGMGYYKLRQFGPAAQILEAAHKIDPTAEWPIWNRASLAGISADGATAATWLEKLKALNTKMSPRMMGWARRDKDFSAVRADPRFRAVVFEGAGTPASQPGEASGEPTAERIGVKECDNYLNEFRKCIAERVPPASKAAMYDARAKIAAAWKKAAATAAGRGALAIGCKTALEAVKKATAAFGCTWGDAAE